MSRARSHAKKVFTAKLAAAALFVSLGGAELGLNLVPEARADEYLCNQGDTQCEADYRDLIATGDEDPARRYGAPLPYQLGYTGTQAPGTIIISHF